MSKITDLDRELVRRWYRCHLIECPSSQCDHGAAEAEMAADIATARSAHDRTNCIRHWTWRKTFAYVAWAGVAALIVAALMGSEPLSISVSW